MKVYVSADIEGVTGVTHWDECNKSHADYPEFRRQMTEEVVAACNAAFEGGASEIWIKDAHASARNVSMDRLPARTRTIRGWSGHPQLMVQELDASFDAVVMVGYHSSAGSGGNPLAHTISGKLDRIFVNGEAASEFLLHTYAAARHGVPVVFVSGDQALVDEVRRVNASISTVAVKYGVGNSTVSISYGEALARIAEGVRAGLDARAKCAVSLPSRFEVRLDYRQPVDAFRAAQYPGAQLEGHKVVRFDTSDYDDVMRMLLFTV